MLDQFLSWFFSSWMVFPVLVVALLALSEFGWRVGLARSRTKSEKDGLITLDERPLARIKRQSQVIFDEWII
jgi:hypothetical protein